MTPILRRHLTPQFLAAAEKKKNTHPHGIVEMLLTATEHVRQSILLPGSKDLDSLVIETKDTSDQRAAEQKTLTIKTDKECEAAMERQLKASFPDALLISEEKYGALTPDEKKTVLLEAMTTDRQVILTDPLDATRDFRLGGDGYGTMVALLHKGEIKAAVVERSTDYADPTGLGHTLTFEAGDAVRIDGKLVQPLSKRKFPTNPAQLRGYGALEFIAPMHGKPIEGFPDLLGKFDSLSDIWTCSTMFMDLLKGEHHFMLTPAPADIFDYPAGIALIQQAGGVVRFLDGTNATFDEIAKRQTCFIGDAPSHDIHNTLVFAVSEDVFKTVQKTVLEAAGVTLGAKPSSPKNPAA